MLQDELAAFQAKWTEKATPERRILYEKGIEDLRRSGLLDRALGVGALAPDFELADARGGTIRLADVLDGGRAVVLAFYRGGWCPYCNIQLRAYQKALADIRHLRAELIAVSPETPDSSLSTAEKNSLEFPVLSDVGQGAADAFGIVYSLPPDLRAAYAANGIDLGAVNGEDDWRLPVPVTFVIAPDRRIVLSFVDADYRHRLEPEEILGVLAALHPPDRVRSTDLASPRQSRDGR